MRDKFDLRHLRYFVAVAEELNFSRAAERLYISQPPLSRQIRELETMLGTQLFVRDTASVKLTASGEIALHRARKLLEDAAAFVQDINRITTRGAKTIRVGASVALPVAMHKPLVAAWKKALGVDALEIEIGDTETLLPRMRRNQLEYALIGAAADLSSLEHEVVHTVPVTVALAPSHPAARKRVIALRDLGDTPFFWFPRSYNPGYYDYYAKVFAQAGFKPKYISVQPGQLRTLEIIAQGGGCTLLNRSQVDVGVKGLVHRPLKEAKALELGIAAVWRGKEDDPELNRRGRLFAAVTRQVLGMQPTKARLAAR